MKYETIFDLVATEFPKAGIDYLLIGGFAVNAYGYSRGTTDIDFMIATDTKEKVFKVLRQFGYQSFELTDSFSRWKDEKGHSLVVDVLFTDKVSMAQLIDSSAEKKIVGCNIRIPALDHLIAMKLHAIKQQPEKREWKDWIDIVELIKLNQIDLRSELYAELFTKFGTKELYERALKSVEKT